MAFTLAQKTYVLDFQDGPCAGMEVTVADMDFGGYMGLVELADELMESGSFVAEARATAKLLPTLAESIRGWNVVDERGASIAPSEATLRAFSPTMLSEILTHWIKAVAGIPDPLEQASRDLDETGIPMEALAP